MVLGLFFACSETKRLTGRSGCCLIGGALPRIGGEGFAGDACLMDCSGPTFPPPLPVGFDAVGGMYDSPYSSFSSS